MNLTLEEIVSRGGWRHGRRSEEGNFNVDQVWGEQNGSGLGVRIEITGEHLWDYLEAWDGREYEESMAVILAEIPTTEDTDRNSHLL